MRRNRELAGFLLLSLVACTGHKTPRATPPRAAEALDTRGWEGFFELENLDEKSLAARQIPIAVRVIRDIESRVVRLILAGGEQEATEAELEASFRQYCGRSDDRAWNEDRCAAYEAKSCLDGLCTYQHFGSCSGFMLGGGVLVTAAHCIAPLVENADLLGRSRVLAPGPDGRPGKQSPIRVRDLLKREFEKDWVVTDSSVAMDVALLSIDDAGLPSYAFGPVPERGSVVFVVGYPRVEGRSEDAMRSFGYRAVPGRASVSFGRVDDANAAGRPFCSRDGRQEGWGLAEPCVSRRPGQGQELWRGVISTGNFTTSMDTINGYSGAPVFDARGVLVGINSTVAGGVNPQEGYVPELRAVVTRAELALGGTTEDTESTEVLGSVPTVLCRPAAPSEVPFVSRSPSVGLRAFPRQSSRAALSVSRSRANSAGSAPAPRP